MIDKKQLVSGIYLTSILLIITATFSLQVKKTPIKKQVTIFVHGTVFPFLAFLNPHKTYIHNLDSQDWYSRCIGQLRTNPLLQEDCIMLDVGLHKIDNGYLQQYTQQTLPPALSKKGAYQAIGAYHTITKLLANNSKQHVEHDYYTFGFTGLLSESHRKQTAEDLYQTLIKLIYTYKQQNYEPIITLCGYSHGGNVILYTAQAAERSPAAISIDTVVLLGTPLQTETAQLAKKSIFKTVINIYSTGDTVQSGDSFSTPHGITHRKLSDLFNTQEYVKVCPGKHLYDLQITADEDKQAFGHCAYWFFNHYSPGLFNTTPVNTQAVYNTLTPLPLVILIPLVKELLKKTSFTYQNITDLTLSLNAHESYFGFQVLNAHNNQCLLKSANIKNSVSRIQQYAQTSWQPYVHESFSMRLAVGALTALQTLVT